MNCRFSRSSAVLRWRTVSRGRQSPSAPKSTRHRYRARAHTPRRSSSQTTIIRIVSRETQQFSGHNPQLAHLARTLPEPRAAVRSRASSRRPMKREKSTTGPDRASSQGCNLLILGAAQAAPVGSACEVRFSPGRPPTGIGPRQRLPPHPGRSRPVSQPWTPAATAPHVQRARGKPCQWRRGRMRVNTRRNLCHAAPSIAHRAP